MSERLEAVDESTEVKEIPMPVALAFAIDAIIERANSQINSLVEATRAEQGLPAGATPDAGRKVWVLPVEP